LYQPKTIYTKVALETIRFYLDYGKLENYPISDIPEEIKTIRRGCFVSIHKLDGELRGCIGTIEPQEADLVEEIRRNAVSAAFRDKRFDPLSKEELENIEISVDVLTVPERVYGEDDLDPLIYGVIVSDGLYKRGVLLPSLPGIDSLEKQLDIVKRKAGLSHKSLDELEIYRFSSTRHH
jgi:AmmeMemoRadiSam system protein A